MPTTADYLGDLVNLRKELAEALACNPTLVKASEDETFSTLTPKVLEMVEEFNKVTNNGTDFSYSFSRFDKAESMPAIRYTRNCKNFTYMFNHSTVKTIESIDVSNGENFVHMFSYSRISHVPSLDTSKGTNFEGMFYACGNLVTIDSIDFSNAKSNIIFAYNAPIRNLTLKGSIPVNIEIATGYLTVQSAKNVINALVDYSNTDKSGMYTCKFAASVKDKLNSEGNASPNGNTWLEYIVDKGWKVG